MVEPEEKAKFLEQLRNGVRPDVAAIEIGSTATRMRRLARRDEEFGLEYEAAMAERREAHADKIRKEMDERSFDREDPASYQLLKLQAEMYLDELEYKRMKTVQHGNEGGQPFRIQAVLPEVTQELLDQIPLDVLEDLLAKMGAIEEGNVLRLKELTEGLGL